MYIDIVVLIIRARLDLVFRYASTVILPRKGTQLLNMYLIIDIRTIGMQWCRSVSLAELFPLLEHPLELGAKLFSFL